MKLNVNYVDKQGDNDDWEKKSTPSEHNLEKKRDTVAYSGEWGILPPVVPRFESR